MRRFLDFFRKNKEEENRLEKCIKEIERIENKEEREFKEYWLLQEMLIEKCYERWCRSCKYHSGCWHYEGAVYNTDTILQTCKHNLMKRAIELKESVPHRPMHLGFTLHQKWHQEIIEMLK